MVVATPGRDGAKGNERGRAVALELCGEVVVVAGPRDVRRVEVSVPDVRIGDDGGPYACGRLTLEKRRYVEHVLRHVPRRRPRRRKEMAVSVDDGGHVNYDCGAPTP